MPLHHAAEKGHVEILRLLLEAGAPVNAELSNGMTALHWCSQNGHVSCVEKLIACQDTKVSVKDSFDRTPLLCAAEQGHRDIVYLLAPGKIGEKLSATARGACESFEATIVDFGIDAVPRERKQRVLKNHSVYDLIYGWDDDSGKAKVPSQVKNVKVKPAFRWLHLPSNNLAWCQDLLTKVFVEAGHREIEDFKALTKCFNQEHRGQEVHANYMRTFCQRIPPMTIAKAYTLPIDQPTVLQEEGHLPGSSPTPQITIEPATPLKNSVATLSDKEKERDIDSDKGTPKSEKEKKKSKAERFAERHSKKASKAESPLRNGTPGGKGSNKGGDKNTKDQAVKSEPKVGAPSGKTVLFVSLFGGLLSIALHLY